MENQPTPEEPQSWGQGRWDDSIRLRQADFAVGIERMQKKERLLRRLAKKTMDGTIGQRTVEPEDGGDDMIVLGNYSVNIGSEPQLSRPPIAEPLPQQPASLPVSQPSQQSSQQPAATPAGKATWQKLWPWLLAAAVPAAGAGGAAVTNYLSKPTPQATDTWIDWDFKATPSSGVEDNEQ